MVGKDYLMQFCEANQDLLETNTYDFLVKGIIEAHQAIKEGFVKNLNGKGFEVKETTEGYLVKRKMNKANWVCVHGGTSCSIVAIVGSKLFTGNVGDSTGIMSTSHPILCDNMLKFVGDSGDIERMTSSMEVSGSGEERSNTMVITSDHSPESPVEFNRMRNFRASTNDPKQPALQVLLSFISTVCAMSSYSCIHTRCQHSTHHTLFVLSLLFSLVSSPLLSALGQVVYDASMQDKSRCPSVFELDASGCPIVTNRGRYVCVCVCVCVC